MPLNGTLNLYRGDDTVVPLQVYQSDQVTPYVLSGCAITFTARRDLYNSPVILQKVVTNHLAPESGMSQISFVPGDTSNINDQKHFFDIKLTATGGTITTLMDGWMYVTPSSSSCPA